MNHDLQQDELGWTAFRYVASELSSEESAAFELRLADDQEAREAVVRAVQLSSTVAESASIARRPATPAIAATTARRNWLVAATILAGMMLVSATAIRTWLAAPNGNNNTLVATESTAGSADGDASRADDLVSVWTSTEPSNDGQASDSNINSDTANDADRVEIELAEVGRNELVVPEWMIAAVSIDVDGYDGLHENEETN